MNKQPDFGDDLAALNDSVAAEVGDVLQVLQQKRSATKPASVPITPEPLKASVESAADASAVSEQPASSHSMARRQRSPGRSRLMPTVEREEPLENVTTRLRQKTNELLTEAALRQRLKKETPSTRQDIIETALVDWFRKHGYLRNRTDDVGE